MIEVTVYKNSKGHYTGFKSLGHAGYAEHGHDIVCAAVSVLVINTINSIETFTKDRFQCKSNEKKGLIEVMFSQDINDKTALLMDSLCLGLEGIQRDYNNGYMNIIYEEV